MNKDETDQEEQDLIKAAAEEVMGWTLLPEGETYRLGAEWYRELHNGKWGYITFGKNSVNEGPFKPLTNENHTVMLRDKLVEMGFTISESYEGKSCTVSIAMFIATLSEKLGDQGFNILSTSIGLSRENRVRTYLSAIKRLRLEK